ncbi:hypothetical protein [Clostridium beijerinckii]|uniref:hypothetical protein n=1 Tax=Clostridium beijerinckii TaxID=1520 RepID=UPI00047E5D1F|nr:hypothetical protein [Clostridium beijerinckii]
MKNIKFVYSAIFILGIFLLLTGCSSKTNSNEVKENPVINNHDFTNTNEVDLNLKLESTSRGRSPLCDNIDINKNIYVNKGNMTNDGIISSIMAILFDRYKGLNDSNVAIEDYEIKKIDTVVETKEGSVFGVLYSVKGTKTRTRWDSNNQSDKWTPTKTIYCSYYKQGDKYELNIIGENPLYYKGHGDKLNTEDIIKKLFEQEYLLPRTFDSDEGSVLLSYSIDRIEPIISKDNIKDTFNIDYSIQGIKGKCFWVFADKDGKGNGTMYRKLVSIGDFYEIQYVD